jgi:hypothetical protein
MNTENTVYEGVKYENPYYVDTITCDNWAPEPVHKGTIVCPEDETYKIDWSKFNQK